MSQRSFEEVWSFIKGLGGEKVRTLDRGWINTIKRVTSDAVYVFSDHSKSGKESEVSRSQFEEIWGELVQTGECSRVKARYVAYAILAQLPEVTYSIRPVTLHLSMLWH